MSTKTYSDSGVDIKKENNIIKNISKELIFRRNGFGKCIQNIGHYAGLIDCNNFILAITTDGVGSKLLISKEVNKYDTIGIDCIAMNVNDLIAIGAEPIAFVDYLAIENYESIIESEIGKGLNKGAEIANITIVGGETATLPDIINTFDLSGTCIGYIKNKEDIIDGKKIKIDDIIIGIPSSGIHSNGYSLIRKIIKENNYNYNDLLPYNKNKTIGEELLTPTRIYIDILKIIKCYDIHGLAHITGGGFLKLKRITNYGFDIQFNNYPEVFHWIEEIGKIDKKEMYKTFNMGIGFIIILSYKNKETIQEILKKTNGKIIGKIIKDTHIKINGIILD